MTPDTVHRIAQEIRHQRGLLTAREKWSQRQEHGQAQVEEAEVVAFWREVLKVAERRLSRIGVTEGAQLS